MSRGMRLYLLLWTFYDNCRQVYKEWQQRHLECETWTRLRALWEGK